MEIKVSPNSFFVFDLDDTLFMEIDFLKSAFRHISTKLASHIGKDIYEEMLAKYYKKENVFQWMLDHHKESLNNFHLQWLIKEYQEHIPSIKLSEEVAALLHKIKSLHLPAGLITDGRSITQRNKLRALGIENYFADIIISEEFGFEKPNEKNYLYFKNKYPGSEFYFFGDNTSKDFIVPAQLGWKTICLKNIGNHIHPQSFDKGPLPDFIISNFSEFAFYC
ncbi:MAG TPA: HAD family hydrolase [Chitinophagaceae bacterium]|jgi:putative hydrolase of the HAD superfamily|nr:HAD family hydrolase [Chitinophagaceae bacterium]